MFEHKETYLGLRELLPYPFHMLPTCQSLRRLQSQSQGVRGRVREERQGRLQGEEFPER